jgi:hypothetical protein
LLTTNWEHLGITGVNGIGRSLNVTGSRRKSIAPNHTSRAAESNETPSNDVQEIKRAVKKTVKEKPALPPPQASGEVQDEEDDMSGAMVVKSSPWSLKIDGLNDEIPVTGARLPTFTSNMPNSGAIAIETMSAPGHALNRHFMDWLAKPVIKSICLRVLDPVGETIELWHAKAVPLAMGFSELNIFEEEPFVTQFALTLSDIKIEVASS